MKIELPSGGWWEVKDKLSHGDHRWIAERAQEDALGLVGRIEKVGLDLERLRSMWGSGGSNGAGTTATSPAEEDALLEKATVSWSFPEPVTRESILAREEKDVAFVLNGLRAFYGLGVPVPERDLGKSLSVGGSSSPS